MVGKPDIKRISKKEGNISGCDMVEKPEIKGISKERRGCKWIIMRLKNQRPRESQKTHRNTETKRFSGGINERNMIVKSRKFYLLGLLTL